MKSLGLTLLLLTCLLQFGCGVKGDPLPPEKPTSLGRGRPNFTRAVKDISVRPESVGLAPSRRDEDDDAAAAASDEDTDRSEYPKAKTIKKKKLSDEESR